METLEERERQNDFSNIHHHKSNLSLWKHDLECFEHPKSPNLISYNKHEFNNRIQHFP